MSLAGGADENGAKEPFDLHGVEKHGFALGAGDRHVSAFNVQLPADKQGQFPGDECPGGTLHFPLNRSSNERRHASRPQYPASNRCAILKTLQIFEAGSRS